MGGRTERDVLYWLHASIMNSLVKILLVVCLAWALSARGGECLWHVTFSDPDGRAQGAASAYLFAGEAWGSLDALEAAILSGALDTSSAVASFQLTPGTSDRLFTVPGDAVDFLDEAVYAIFSGPTVDESVYYDLGWTNPNHGSPLQSGNLVGYYVDDAGVTHPVGVAVNDVGLTRVRTLPGSVPEPNGVLLLLAGLGVLGLQRRKRHAPRS